MPQLLLLVMALSLSPMAMASVAEIFHVTPILPATESCPPPCHTLDQYAQNISLLTGHTNITLVFLAGIHSLSYGWNFSGNGQNVILQGQNSRNLHADSGNRCLVTVSTFIVTNLASLEMYDINLIGGMNNGSGNMSLKNISDVGFSTVYFSGIFVMLESVNQTTVNDCDFRNGDIQQAGANLVITDTNFTALSLFTVSMRALEMQNCLVIGSDPNIVCSYSQCNATVLNTTFTGNRYGLTIIAESIVTCGVITIEECNFVNNYIYGVHVNSKQFLHRVMDMLIKRSKFYNNTYYGVFAHHLVRNLTISCSENSMFLEDDPAVSVAFIRVMWIENCVLNNTNVQIAASNMEDLYIKNSMFTNGLMFSMFIQSLKIENCEFNGGNIGLYLDSTQRVLIQNSSISNYRLFGMISVIVSEVVISKGSHISHNYIGVASVNSGLTVNDTVFTGNDFGVAALLLESRPQIPEQYQIIKISNSSFNKNNGGLLLLNLLLYGITIESCRFEENTGTPISSLQTTFELRGETVFRENTAARGGGLGLYSNSTVVFGSDSHTMFINNRATEFGGAIYIGQMISFPPELLVAIDRATEPGNIPAVTSQLTLIDDLLAQHQQSCFYNHQSKNTFQVTFNSNTAQLGGWDIFGLTSRDCSVTKFEYDTSDLSFQISSNPTRVCFCTNNMPECIIRNWSQLVHEENRYPGESFKVSVALAGYNFSRVEGSVYTNVLGSDYNNIIGENRHLQTAVLRNCSEFEYAISSANSSAILVLTAQDRRTEQENENEVETSWQNLQLSRCNDINNPCAALLTTPIYINVTLEDCPLGFMLNDANVCDCDEIINSINDISASSITCDLHDHTGYINREGTVWIGVDTSQNNTDIYYWHQYCPPDYCNSSRTPVDLTSPDSQCNSSRAGILCGRCAANHTLQLGGNKCIPLSSCNNNYLSLIIVFTALGILLVAFIKVLDLTVARGTVNGLILYANIVWRYNTILFPQQTNISHEIIIPVAWINLDFGIETCFSEHLDQLTKTGLQFVFPVYIWCIAGLIIFVSHYSKRATKLFGNNSVGVLATLFLLSYDKISRNIIDTFTIANIMDSNNTQRKVWALDGTIEFGQTPGHIVLIIIALVFLFTFWLPFTLSLLLVPFLRAKSHLRPFHWINKLKPFLDTFYGPYKDKKQHQVWTGILLIYRMVLLIVYATTSTLNPNANILLMSLIAIILLVYTAMVSLHYKKWYISALEVLYILNLMFLGVAFLFYQTLTPAPDDENEYPLSPIAATSVSIALIQFACIFVFHTIKQVNLTTKIQNYFRKRGEARETEIHITDSKNEDPDATYQLVVVEENFAPLVTNDYDPTILRESLLEN